MTSHAVILDKAFEIVDELGLHIPNFSLRPACSKLSVTQIGTIKLKGAQAAIHITCCYTCACAVDHTKVPRSNVKSSKRRQIAWEYVGCTAWIKLIMTHVGKGE